MVYVAATSGPDRAHYGGMYAFGDDLLFLAVFSVAAVVPTGAALLFLRPYPRFWAVFSVTALVVAATAIAALVGHRMAHTAPFWSFLAVLRILISPCLALTFFASALITPARSPRLSLLLATATETAVFGSVVAMLIRPR